MNGVCVRWRGWIDLERLDGVGCLEFDEERAMVGVSEKLAWGPVRDIRDHLIATRMLTKQITMERSLSLFEQKLFKSSDNYCEMLVFYVT